MLVRNIHPVFLYFLMLLLLLLLFSGCSPETSPKEKDVNTEEELYDPPFQTLKRFDIEKALNRPKLILFVIIDTLRADHLGLYGHKGGLTPNIDNFAKHCYVFDRAISASSWTRPSVASMFTACYPSSIGIHTKEDPLPEDLLTLAEILNIYGGYQCHAVSANGHAGKAVGFGQGFNNFILPSYRVTYEDDYFIFPADAVTKTALDYLPNWIKEAKNKPIFLFLHYVDPHDPYVPHPGLLDTPEPKGKFNGSRAELKKLDSIPKGQMDKKDIERIKHLYRGEVKFCDLWIGKLLKGIAKLQVFKPENVMTIITADHGEGLWKHGIRAHGQNLHEEQVHVPLLIHMPGINSSDINRILQPVSLIDLAPTILTTCGINIPDQFQGQDLTPLMKGLKRSSPNDLVYSEVAQIKNVNFEALIWRKKKLIRDRNISPINESSYQMYDLSQDPDEYKVLGRQGKRPKWSPKLIKTLKRWGDVNKTDSKFIKKIDVEKLDKATLDNLRALGYLGH